MSRAVVLGIGLACALAACGPSSPAPSAVVPPDTRAGASAAAPAGAAPPSPPLERVTIGSTALSLSYLPAKLADTEGYFQEEGLAVEFVQTRGPTVIPSLLSGDVDFTTVLSAVGANAGQGGETRIVQFHSVRLQHVVSVRPEITAVPQLAGKRFGVESLGTLTAFEVRKLVDHYALPDVAIIAIGGEAERIAAMQNGAIDAGIGSVPSNIVFERLGFPTLLRMATFLDIPQAGFGAAEALLRDHPERATRVLRAAARALPLVRAQPALIVERIGAWLDLSPAEATRAYDLVADTYSPNGLPTDAQQAAYVELLQATASVPADVPATRLFDFTTARQVAAELGLPSQ